MATQSSTRISPDAILTSQVRESEKFKNAVEKHVLAELGGAHLVRTAKDGAVPSGEEYADNLHVTLEAGKRAAASATYTLKIEGTNDETKGDAREFIARAHSAINGNQQDNASISQTETGGEIVAGSDRQLLAILNSALGKHNQIPLEALASLKVER